MCDGWQTVGVILVARLLSLDSEVRPMGATVAWHDENAVHPGKGSCLMVDILDL